MKHAVDAHVGKRIRYRRLVNGITQQQLAEFVGIKFQQIQKYESGVNRVSASRLWDIATSLNVPVSFFFEGLEADTQTQHHSDDLPCDTLTDKEAVNLLRFYYALPNQQRRSLFDLVRVLGNAA
ncbi:MAG TPA: helix-turn-helix transcriptional regulator [Roseovarius sp.]